MFKKDSTAHRVKDFIVSDRFFNIYEDAESKILWTDVDKSHNHLKYYLSDNYIPHSDKKGLLGFLYNFSQRIMFVYKRIILSKHLKESSSVLDYGSGDGKFAKYLEKKGKKIFTYDP
jgi:2-polyprenyl-3-methyl-5-hydroxy-6-metoxy-1,4-benzoquinol methylase